MLVVIMEGEMGVVRRVAGNGSTNGAHVASGGMTGGLAMALEPRFLFDAAGVATAQDAAQIAAKDAGIPAAEPVSADHHMLAALAGEAHPDQPAASKEIVFVDAKAADSQELIRNAPAGAQVFVLDAARDGLSQIAEVMENQQGVTGLHILSHGSQASFSLGSSTIGTATLGTHQQDLATIGAAMAPGGDILLYGCDVGKGTAGQAFIDSLAAATGADVAASTDATGAAALGGNWVLERQSGTVETRTLTDAGYSHLLANPTVVSIEDGDSDNVVSASTPLTYTVVFSKDIDASTVDASDFSNAGSSGMSIGTITKVSAGIFTVQVTPTTPGTLQLQIAKDAIIQAADGTQLDTSSAIPDNDTLTVERAPLDTGGNLLDFSGTPTLVTGTALTQGAVYKYTNVLTVGGVQVDAFVTLTDITNATLTTLDNNSPGSYSYANIAGSKLFAPEIKTSAANGGVTFTIDFKGTDGNAIKLLNFYNNSLDIDGPEMVEYGGFDSFTLGSSSDLKTLAGTGSNLRFQQNNSSTSYSGLAVNDTGRVQTHFNDVSSIQIKMGATGDTGATARQYGAAFGAISFASAKSYSAPTVNGLTTTNRTPTLTGSVGSAYNSGTDSLSVTVNGTTYTTGSGQVTVNGTAWTLTIPTALGNTSTPYDVKVTRHYGGPNLDIVDQTTNELTVVGDSTPPVVLSSTRQSPSTEATNATSVTFRVVFNEAVTGVQANDFALSGTAASGATIGSVTEVTPGVYDVVVNGLTNANGTLNLDLAASPTINDLAGNSLTNTTISGADETYIIDQTPPTTPTVVAKTTNSTTPSITGTATVGSGEVLTVAVNGTTYTAGDGNLVLTGSNWTLTIPQGNALTQGTYAVTATVTDAAGNAASDTTTNELVVDTTPPTAPTVAAKTTNSTTPAITGTATVGTGEVLTVVVNGTTYTAGDGNLVLTGSNWTLTIPQGNALTQGTYAVTATVTDAAGNATSDATTNELVIDTTPPTAPTVAAKTTNSTTPSITGTATVGSGEVLTVVVNGTTYTAGDGNLVLTGSNWTLTIPQGNALAQGTYAVTATVTEAAGNATSDATTNELVVDTTPPATPTVVAKTTSSTTPAITGTATVGSGEVLTVVVNGTTYTAGDGNLVLTGSNWTLTIPQGNALTQGTYAVTATVTDAAGNATSDATTNELVVDTTPPTAPTVDPQTSGTQTPTITGTATVGTGEVLTVVVNGATYTVVPNGDGRWSLDLRTATPTSGTLEPLSNGGAYDVVATVTDAAGNASSDTASAELVINLPAPLSPVSPLSPPVLPAPPLPAEPPLPPADPSLTLVKPPVAPPILSTVSGSTATPTILGAVITNTVAPLTPTRVLDFGGLANSLSFLDGATQSGNLPRGVVLASDASPDGPRLSVIGTVGDRVISAGQQNNIPIPAGTFQSTDPQAIVKLEATQADGSPLPVWLKFDASTGTFTGTPPADLDRPVNVKVLARDNQGAQAVTEFRISVGQKEKAEEGTRRPRNPQAPPEPAIDAPADSPPQAPPGDAPPDGQPEGTQDNLGPSPDGQAPDGPMPDRRAANDGFDRPLPVGKLPFSQQLGVAAGSGVAAEIAALLHSLEEIMA
ncbi:DUF4347 domain-containing protein [Azospirillum sp. A26]|uniref:DUF4347 domain-containing protein n=1 Tax=Azospirillum sp. A26 TaxID=3160607 RepID=UPI00366F979E